MTIFDNELILCTLLSQSSKAIVDQQGGSVEVSAKKIVPEAIRFFLDNWHLA